MKINAKFKSLRFDSAKYREALRKTLEEAITQAAFAWLQAVVSAVPSWSGASRGTLIKLASSFGAQVDISISSTAPYERTDLGIANSEGRLNLDQADAGCVSFQYSTSLAHLIWNEYNNANITRDRTKWRHVELINPGPYRFQEKGQAAVKEAFQSVRLPDPRQFIATQAIVS